jgi:hypothetical protein
MHWYRTNMNLQGALTLLEFRQKGQIWAPISNQVHRERREEGWKTYLKGYWHVLEFKGGGLRTAIGEFWSLDLDITS